MRIFWVGISESGSQMGFGKPVKLCGGDSEIATEVGNSKCRISSTQNLTPITQYYSLTLSFWLDKIYMIYKPGGQIMIPPGCFDA